MSVLCTVHTELLYSSDGKVLCVKQQILISLSWHNIASVIMRKMLFFAKSFWTAMNAILNQNGTMFIH